MGKLYVEGELNESQMTEIIDSVMNYVRKTEVEDLMFDTEVCGYRIYVDFAIGLNDISIKDADIQGSCYNLDVDSFVLKHRLGIEMLDFSKERTKSKIQTLDIFQDQQESILNHAI